MIDQWLAQLAQSIKDTMWLAPLLALLAGALTSITPCALSSIPLVVGYVGGVGEKNTGRAFRYSVTFAVGTAVTFVTMGIIATQAHRLMGRTSQWWYFFLGALMILMALQTWGIINLIPSTNLISRNKKRGYVGALLAGVLGGIFSSPCSTPVLIALLAIVAGQGSMAWGILLMLLYSLGHSFLVVIAGTSVGFVQRINASNQYAAISKILKMVMGLAILLIGIYMFYLGL